MGNGYEIYPDTYLRAEDKETLLRSSFIEGEPTPDREALGALGGPRVQGTVRGPGGVPVERIRISGWGDAAWNWGETGPDGTFTIGLPEEASGPVTLSVHAPEAAACRWLGYHTSGGLTSWREEAAPVAIAEGAGLPVEVRLSGAVDELRAAQRTVRGTVVGPDGRPVPGIAIRAIDSIEQYWETGRDGRFEIPVPSGLGEYRHVLALTVDVAMCGRFVGYYGRDGFTNVRGDALLEIGAGDPNLTLEVRLPASPAELCRRQPAVLGGPWTPRTLSGLPSGGLQFPPG